MPPSATLGFGTYRVTNRNPVHHSALRAALQSGHCNWIDTSSNYMNGEAEHLVGEVLGTSERIPARRDLRVVTKLGYLQGSALEEAKARAQRDPSFKTRWEIVEVTEDCWHSMAPEFLEQELSHSAMRLGAAVGAPDFVLLHNPEYYLHRGGSHAEYLRRLERAFGFLESAACAGRIGAFGVSSNSFAAPADSPILTPLAELLAIAQRMGARHFRAIQLPFNLLEPAAALEINSGGKTPLQCARDAGLVVLTNRPLNAIAAPAHGAGEEQLIRLVSWPPSAGRERAVFEELKEALSLALKEEAEQTDLGFQWAHRIHRNLEKLANFQTWRNIRAFQIEPDLAQRGTQLPPGEARDWFAHYSQLFARVLRAVDAYADHHVSYETEAWGQLLDSLAPALRAEASLERKLLAVYSAIPGVSTILVGMRRPEYARALCEPLRATIDAESAFQILKQAQKALEPHAHAP